MEVCHTENRSSVDIGLSGISKIYWRLRMKNIILSALFRPLGRFTVIKQIRTVCKFFMILYSIFMMFPFPGLAQTYLHARPSAEFAETGKIVKIVDGDTVRINIGGTTERVRLIGINTPETGEYFAEEARIKTEELLIGKTVGLEADPSQKERGKYGRLLRYVWLPDNQLSNLIMILEGYAYEYKYEYGRYKYREKFRRAEQYAQDHKKGIWSEDSVYKGRIVIRKIFYDGKAGRTEKDEYAEIANIGNVRVELGGWRLNAGDYNQNFVFPRSSALSPNQTYRVYTDEYHEEYGGFTFGSARALWSNKGECGYLYDAKKVQVSEFCYSF